MSDFIDINKPFRRVGNFAPFENEIFNTLTEATIYAKSGKYGGTAVPGLLVKVYNSSTKIPDVYVISEEYNLERITANSSGSGSGPSYSNSEITFDYNSQESARRIEIQAGATISLLTLVIEEAFDIEDAITVSLVDNTGAQLLIVPMSYYIEAPFQCITDEDGSEFVYKLSKNITQKSKIIVDIINAPTTGRAKLKIN